MKNEEQLSAQLQGLRDQFSLRKSSLQDHVGHLEIMREEVWKFNELTILLPVVLCLNTANMFCLLRGPIPPRHLFVDPTDRDADGEENGIGATAPTPVDGT